MSPPRRGAAAAAQYGEGARIYVGGVPDLVSVNMVRSHFSRWGQVCVDAPCRTFTFSSRRDFLRRSKFGTREAVGYVGMRTLVSSGVCC